MSPIFIWFSFHPLIRFGRDGTMNYELSIAVVFVLMMALASLPIIFRNYKYLVKNRAAWLALSFFIISSISLLWTANLTRGILSTGILGMLLLVFLGALSLKKKFINLVPKIIKIYLISTFIICGLAVLQFFAGIWLAPDVSLLCAGCVADQFGFVRPNLFLIEPQFLGNALLPAALTLSYLIVSKNQSNWYVWLGNFLIVMTLILTLSRGAILAFAVGLVWLVIVYHKNIVKIIKVFAVFAASFIVALFLQGLTAEINPNTNQSFRGAVSSSVNQLSMGLIDISEIKKSAPKAKIENKKQPAFEGYVEESTSARTTRTELALGRWGANIQTVVFGSGVGSAGVAINQKYPEQLGSREIVQNEYVEVLLEKGLVGLVAFLVVLGSIFMISRQQKWVWAIILAFMTQWMFFSGYPNALHIYLALIIVGVYFTLRRDQLELARRY